MFMVMYGTATNTSSQCRTRRFVAHASLRSHKAAVLQPFTGPDKKSLIEESNWGGWRIKKSNHKNSDGCLTPRILHRLHIRLYSEMWSEYLTWVKWTAMVEHLGTPSCQSAPRRTAWEIAWHVLVGKPPWAAREIIRTKQGNRAIFKELRKKKKGGGGVHSTELPWQHYN